MESFASDPATFIQTWLESQSRDLETILGSGPTEGMTVRQEDLRRSEFFGLPWVEEVRIFIMRLWMTRLSKFYFVRPLLFKKAYALPAKACSDADINLSLLFYFRFVFSLLYVRLARVDAKVDRDVAVNISNYTRTCLYPIYSAIVARRYGGLNVPLYLQLYNIPFQNHFKLPPRSILPYVSLAYEMNELSPDQIKLASPKRIMPKHSNVFANPDSSKLYNWP